MLTILAGSLLHQTASILEISHSPHVLRFIAPLGTGNPSPIRQTTPLGLPLHQRRSSDPPDHDPPSTPLRQYYCTNISPTTAAHQPYSTNTSTTTALLPLYHTRTCTLLWVPTAVSTYPVQTPLSSLSSCVLTPPTLSIALTPLHPLDIYFTLFYFTPSTNDTSFQIICIRHKLKATDFD